MALHLPDAGGDHEPQALASINTTPLVDVMLVLLIIFLITVPVIRYPQRVQLPRQQASPQQPQAGDVVVSVTRDGHLFWGEEPLADRAELRSRLAGLAARKPQPRVRISADRDADYAPVGAVVDACRDAGIDTVGFITRPPAR